MSVTRAVSAPPKLLQLDEGLEKENQAVVMCIFSGSLARTVLCLAIKQLREETARFLRLVLPVKTSQPDCHLHS